MNIREITTTENVLRYLEENLNWQISSDGYEISAEDATWDYYPEDIGLKDEDFAKIKSLSQLKPIADDMAWTVFFVEFDSNKMLISALRKIFAALIYQKRNSADHKIWDKENLLFIAFWGEKTSRTTAFLHFSESEKSLATLNALYFEPKNEDSQKLLHYANLLNHLSWQESEEKRLAEWKKCFTTEYKQVIRQTEILTKELAKSAKKIREAILSVLEIENENGDVHKLFKKFKDNLLHDMDEKQFADMYAQTVCYGLFSARCLSEETDILKAIDNIPDTNPFLRNLLKEGFFLQNDKIDEIELNGIIMLLQNTDIKAITNEFNRQTRQGFEDPVIHFYEDFLTEYDKETKMDRGVFYTPLPVVNFIVKSVDSILKTQFGIADGLACDDKKVQILDPATGTGTFLRQTILKIKENFDQKHKNLSNEELSKEWNKYVILSLLHRLYGFELMMAPYAVAHMKLAMALKDTGYNFAGKSRLKVFLTNSLEEAGDSSGMQSLFEEDAIAQEAMSANKVKKEAQINVVIGNPPYSGISANNNDWIAGLLNDYRTVNGKPLGERKVWFNDDYCKFIRMAQSIIDKNGSGVLAFINPNGFIDNLSFKGMRWSLLNSFDKIYILDLHGNPMRKETAADGGKDENIFDITTGVSINLFVKTTNKKKSLAEVFYADKLGLRKDKFDFLNKNSFDAIDWQNVSTCEPNYFFRPLNVTEQEKYYDSTFSVRDVFGLDVTGIVTMGDTFALAETPEKLEQNISDVLNNNYSEDELTEKYQLGKNYSHFVLSNKDKLKFDKNAIKRFHYRPFDFNYIYYDSKILWRDRFEVMKHMLKQNIGFIISRQAITDNWSHVLVSEYMIDNRLIYSNKGIASFFPLYLYDEDYGTCQPNLNEEIVAKIEKIVKEKIEPLSLLDYIYAVLHSPSYRTKYKEFLKIDFPRIPFPKDKEQFASLSALGSKLRCLHLMKAPELTDSAVLGSCTLFNADGSAVSSSSDTVTQRKYDHDGMTGKVWINKTQYFASVDESTWAFYIGGYQVADKWLKDRKGRALSAEDILHYSRIIAVLKATGQIMSEIDAVFSV